jgi:hypothetical protein
MVIDGDKLKEEIFKWDTAQKPPYGEKVRRKLYDLVHQCEVPIKSPEEVSYKKDCEGCAIGYKCDFAKNEYRPACWKKIREEKKDGT